MLPGMVIRCIKLPQQLRLLYFWSERFATFLDFAVSEKHSFPPCQA